MAIVISAFTMVFIILNVRLLTLNLICSDELHIAIRASRTKLKKRKLIFRSLDNHLTGSRQVLNCEIDDKKTQHYRQSISKSIFDI